MSPENTQIDPTGRLPSTHLPSPTRNSGELHRKYLQTTTTHLQIAGNHHPKTTLSAAASSTRKNHCEHPQLHELVKPNNKQPPALLLLFPYPFTILFVLQICIFSKPELISPPASTTAINSVKNYFLLLFCSFCCCILLRF
ncbi:hypothetical protein AABB24_039871 [Solanum stoloniferum]|uniref:Uncharacterized protein n=1 Tax=Solanum stoloniferum TaxID=62892 RepID=A0ABD2QSP1_9SOLN